MDRFLGRNWRCRKCLSSMPHIQFRPWDNLLTVMCLACRFEENMLAADATTNDSSLADLGYR